MSKLTRRRARGDEAGSAASLVARRETEPEATCAHCAHRADDRHALEARVAGLVVFSSGFGASVAHSRLCMLHDQLVSPNDTCSAFRARGR
ncbi:MAG TPA: hypothetical protein VL689_04570 [Paraburkholderia sp.]|jgi:hypothetical protein|nr:hypothetical protein [Paraburkholderia sp.]